MINDTIIQLTAKHRYSITLKYEPYGVNKQFVYCTISRPFYKHVGVQRFGQTDEEALERCLQSLEQVQGLEKKFGDIKMPELSEQTLENGYTWHIIGNEEYNSENSSIKIGFRRVGNVFVISDILRVDDKDFCWCEEPYQQVSSDFISLTDMEPSLKQHLKSRQRLYKWDRIGPLCGSAGLAIIEDNKVIKMKTTYIS